MWKRSFSYNRDALLETIGLPVILAVLFLTSGCNQQKEGLEARAGLAEDTESSTNPYQVMRFPQNPIVRPGMSGLDDADGSNINGPSLISVPQWIEKPLGRYYLYFANHHGSHVRLAYADRLEGPWKIHPGGTLRLEDTEFDDHIASPDVHVDEQRRKIVMYYHGRKKDRPANCQTTRAAFSDDGIHFQDNRVDLGESYFRVFQWRDDYYAIAWAGEFYKAKDQDNPWKESWEVGGYPLEDPTAPAGPVPRHAALELDGDILKVFYSRMIDAPEHILMSTIELKADWRSWKASEPVSILKPEMDYEGAAEPIRVSFMGAAHGRVHELRDPGIFRDGDRTYLLYCVAGENGIAIAELK